MAGNKFEQVTEHPLKKPANVTEQQWQKAIEIYDTAKKMGDKYPELTVAQAALETGWFKSMAGNYNYFGQKAGKNQKSVNLRTKEEGANGLYSTRANFRDYDTLEESIDDRIKKWGSKYENAGNVSEALDIIVKNGYATASNYKTSVGGVLNSITGTSKSYSNNSEVVNNVQEPAQRGSYSNKVIYKAPNLKNSSLDLQSSTAEYKNPDISEDTNEVLQAKQEVQEKSFLEEVSKILTQPQQEIAQVQPEQQYVSPDMEDPYNYISLDFPEGEEFQKGGTLENKKLTIKDNIPEIPSYRFPVDLEETPKEFTLNYINSPKYKERLTKQGYKNIESEILERAKRVESTKMYNQSGVPSIPQQVYKDIIGEPYSTIGSIYNTESNNLIIDDLTDKQNLKYVDDELQGSKLPKNSVIAHELGHAELNLGANENRLNNKDYQELLKRQKNYKDLDRKIISRSEKDLSHDMKPTENKADLNALRYELKKSNIYDAGKENFKKEHLKKLKDSFIKRRLLKNYKEEDLIWLMNNIANQEQPNNTYAQNGAIIDPRGQWAHPGEVTIIPGSDITMRGVDFPVLGIDNLGNQQMMYPGQDYRFEGEYVTEYPQNKKQLNKRFKNEKKS